ncbi:MAG: hypothetical protein R3C45_21655 [Phycisphaerales bacterium]
MDTFPQIFVLGRSDASMLIQSAPSGQIQAVISIHGPRDFPCGGFDTVPSTLELIFDDVDVLDQGDPVSVYRSRRMQQRARDVGLSLIPPSAEHVRQIIEFAARVKRVDGGVLCHCDAGISRSPAVAIVCLACWMGSQYELAVAEYVFKLRPSAKPHKGIIRLADEHLGLGGRLSRAVEGVFK